MTLRLARPADLSAIAVIYHQGIRARSATFETRERKAEDTAVWLQHPTQPAVVATSHGGVAGHGDTAVHVATAFHHQGIGRALVAALVAECERQDYFKLVGWIFPDNVASRGLVRRAGVCQVSTYKRHGQLDGVWRDIVIVERRLGAAAES